MPPLYPPGAAASIAFVASAQHYPAPDIRRCVEPGAGGLVRRPGRWRTRRIAGLTVFGDHGVAGLMGTKLERQCRGIGGAVFARLMEVAERRGVRTVSLDATGTHGRPRADAGQPGRGPLDQRAFGGIVAASSPCGSPPTRGGPRWPRDQVDPCAPKRPLSRRVGRRSRRNPAPPRRCSTPRCRPSRCAVTGALCRGGSPDTRLELSRYPRSVGRACSGWRAPGWAKWEPSLRLGRGERGRTTHQGRRRSAWTSRRWQRPPGARAPACASPVAGPALRVPGDLTADKTPCRHAPCDILLDNVRDPP